MEGCSDFLWARDQGPQVNGAMMSPYSLCPGRQGSSRPLDSPSPRHQTAHPTPPTSCLTHHTLLLLCAVTCLDLPFPTDPLECHRYLLPEAAGEHFFGPHLRPKRKAFAEVPGEYRAGVQEPCVLALTAQRRRLSCESYFKVRKIKRAANITSKDLIGIPG